jgi:hypothetical protein
MDRDPVPWHRGSLFRPGGRIGRDHRTPDLPAAECVDAERAGWLRAAADVLDADVDAVGG